MPFLMLCNVKAAISPLIKLRYIKINTVSELHTLHMYWKDVGNQLEILKNKNNVYEEKN